MVPSGCRTSRRRSSPAWRTSSTSWHDLGLVVTALPEALAASHRPEVVVRRSGPAGTRLRRYVFTAIDASNAVANGTPALNPYALVRPGGIPAWELDRFLSHTMPSRTTPSAG